ncbi:thermonuclease family protein [Nonomuraea sp. NPDC051941]|uniref:thermonuclease family protein n=1 Tax=Nonomuraea sp. NPDC051941 TaxID=3364373 RepID=UPI0037C88815
MITGLSLEGGTASAAPPSGADLTVHGLQQVRVSRAGVTGVLDFGFGLRSQVLLDVALPRKPGIAAVREWAEERHGLVFVRLDDARRRGRYAATIADTTEPSYAYQAGNTRVIDGDTLETHLHLGYGLWLDVKLRLAGLNAPELKTAAGVNAAAWAQTWVAARQGSLVVRTTRDKREKYGRLLASVEHDGQTLNDALLQAGFAVPYDGGRRET